MPTQGGRTDADGRVQHRPLGENLKIGLFVCKETYFPVRNWDLDFMPLTCGRDRGFEFCWYIPEIFSGGAAC